MQDRSARSDPRRSRRDALRRLGCMATAALPLAAGWRGSHAQAPATATVAGTAAATGSAAPRVVEVAGGLDHPWSLAFLPDGRMLVTERPGRLRLLSADGSRQVAVDGVPRVYARGQGGLLDVVLSPAFAQDRAIFLSYAEPTANGARTAVARATLSNEASPSLQNLRVIFGQKHDPSGGNHFGSRLVFGRDGNLFVTLGDRFTHRDRAQELDNHYGKIIRIRPDGSVPPDNPFVGRAGALPEIHSYGHRNVQGAALHPASGRLWTHEHGPQGGDEVNLEKAGANYGWPIITYGREYGTGLKIGEGTERAGIEPPLLQWTPSIAPSGMAFYTGDRFPAWRGNLFVGSLKYQMLVRLELDGEKIVREERLLTDLKERVRDVRQGPDGYLYLLTDESKGRLLRLMPGA